MLLKELKRIEYLSVKEGKKDANPDEASELARLKQKLLENGGVNSAAAGLVVASNFRWLYQPYETLIDQAQLEQEDELELELYWDAVKVIESHVKSNAASELLKIDGEQRYYKVLSGYLRSNRISENFDRASQWLDEPTLGKWMLLRGKLKSTIAELLRHRLEAGRATVGTKIEDRVEPLFNKIMKQLNTDVDAESLSTAEKIKVMDKLSGLLADMKGERVKVDAVQVTHNNVFNVIMENKKEVKQLQRAAIELREGDGYDLV